MNLIATYPDAGVLIAANRGDDQLAGKAKFILDDPERIFLASPFLRLEVVPQAIHNKRSAEVSFYEAFFSLVTRWAEVTERRLQTALELASTYGLGAMDSLHVAAAMSLGVDEFITTEKIEKPIHRVVGLKIIRLQIASSR